MNEFVEECRWEWRRLGVPDAVANEMAADLSADLDEAEAEGASLEDVLGNSAFDPRRFAASWALARGVTGPPTPDRPSFRRPSVAIALAAILGVLTVGAGLVLLLGTSGSSVAFVVHRMVVGHGPIRIGQGGLVGPGPLGQPFVGAQISGPDVRPVALLFLLVAIVAVVGLGVIAVYRWSPWSARRQRGGRGTPGWS